MRAEQLRAWRALDLGPAWEARVPAREAGAGDDAAAEPGPGAVETRQAGPGAVETTQAGADDTRTAADGAGVREVGAPRGAGGDPTAGRPSIGADADERRPAGDAVATLDWPGLRAAVTGCRACGLARTRTQTVFGVGDERARWMLVGEAPGAEEDARGEPFVGQAGRLLDNMLATMSLARGRDVYIANVLKCRPPGNRNPEPEEVACCEPFLRRQVELVAPRVIVVMGRFAAQSLLRTEASIASLRGRVHRYAAGDREVPMIVTYHPAYLLRNLTDKAKAWADLCFARGVLQEALAEGAQPQGAGDPTGGP